MTIKFDKKTPQVYARIGGLLYLIVISAGILAQMVISGRLVVAGDAAATAANILNQKSLFQLGFTVYLIEMASQVAMTVLLYLLLKPAGKGVALLALVLGCVGCTIKTLSRLFYIAPLLVLGDTHYLGVFNVEQLQALALFLLNVNDQTAGIAQPFFGVSTILNGTLMYKSDFLPRFLGVLAILGGLGWLTFLYPPLGNQLFPYIVPLALFGSVSQILWFLIKGVNVQQWNRRAVASA